jgi:hypothetical protein
MRDVFASRSAVQLVKSPNLRQQAARRRGLTICGVLALAIASGVIGTLSHRDHGEPLGQPQTGPFSYFPSE